MPKGRKEVTTYLYKTDDTMIEKMDGDYHIQLNKAVLNDNCLNGKIVEILYMQRRTSNEQIN